MNSQRIIGVDIIRAIAVLCVIGGHFFTVNTPYNESLDCDVSLFAQAFLKTLMSNVGVPFFLMLSGYLCVYKTCTRKYYKGILKVLVPYVIISCITWGILNGNQSIKDLFFGILNFTTIKYAWYVEMYIGLFLLIPFLNIAVQQVFKDGKSKYFLLTLLFLTALPPILNRGDIKLVPGFWMMTFPLTFYFIGAFIRLHQPHLKNKILWLTVVLAVTCLTPMSRYLFLSYFGQDVSITGSYYSLINTVPTVILFIILYDIDKVSKSVADIFSFIAVYAFEIFLWSYLYDRLIYPLFISRFYSTQSDFIVWFVPIVIIVFLLSLISAYLYKTVFKLTGKIINKG